MKIRKFQDSDITQIVTLFYETVHSVNKQDYSQEQLDAWAPHDEKPIRLQTWSDSMRHNITYVVENNDIIVGFADLIPDGHLDRLYVHKDFQGQGIASTLVNKLESEATDLGLVEINADASISARPFFEKHGYRVLHSQTVERNGVTLNNFKMIKLLVN
ncbi:putative acetyltransferase [Paenibacillus anaericanus]|uniref:GNAT family N-acetyltransferase n=1 Tax=Paenibacillus anaericanus TaxID=170367 RepID=UPI0027811E05|nr:GNAT family N-acetyltransferase [Paenibacillus anaericanus]MDQ0087831.1 putative acetyltransferase [Paenibacillus anaericanus]